MVNKTRIYIIQNEEGRVINVLSDIANLEIGLISTANEKPDGAVDATIQQIYVDTAAPVEEVDDMEHFITNGDEAQEPVTQDEA